jgi:chemotaxis protein MotA
MKNLANIDEVGHGIAVAFVATIYGVGSANLLFLPAAAKIRHHAHRQSDSTRLIVEGVVAIVEGLNPRMLRRKLAPLADETGEAATSQDSAPSAAGQSVPL